MPNTENGDNTSDDNNGQQMLTPVPTTLATAAEATATSFENNTSPSLRTDESSDHRQSFELEVPGPSNRSVNKDKREMNSADSNFQRSNSSEGSKDSGGGGGASIKLSDDDAIVCSGSTLSPSLDCPICLQTCVHPARLPCGHIFCFLCIKGVAYKSRRCAMCRRDIPEEYLENPQLVRGIDEICETKPTEDGYQWYYEGRNGWWQYDPRTSQDIEDAYKRGEKICTILVAGYLYAVNFENMVQQRQNEPGRCRRVKRDFATIPKKGVAGLRIERPVDSSVSLASDFHNSNTNASTAQSDVRVTHEMPIIDLTQDSPSTSSSSTLNHDHSNQFTTSAIMHTFNDTVAPMSSSSAALSPSSPIVSRDSSSLATAHVDLSRAEHSMDYQNTNIESMNNGTGSIRTEGQWQEREPQSQQHQIAFDNIDLTVIELGSLSLRNMRDSDN